MEIRITLKDVYGETKAYPVCPQSKLFADLAGHKTLTRRDLDLIRRLGYTIQVEQLGVACGQLAA